MVWSSPPCLRLFSSEAKAQGKSGCVLYVTVGLTPDSSWALQLL